MFYFTNVQKVTVSNVTFGRQFGETPIVMFGSIFYRNDKIVTNHKTGEFDRVKAKELIETQEDLANKFGLQVALDVHAITGDAMLKYLEFVLETTDIPIILDGVDFATRHSGLKYVKEVGANTRIIYDSISPDTKGEELFALKESRVDCAILLALNPTDMTPHGRLTVIKEKLLPKAKEAGVSKLLIDTVVFDIPSLGVAAKAIELVKNEFGWPTGNGAINALEFIGDWKKRSKQSFFSLMNSLYTINVITGADWLFYGPISFAKYVFPTIAVMDGLTGYTYALTNHLPLSEYSLTLRKAIKMLTKK